MQPDQHTPEERYEELVERGLLALDDSDASCEGDVRSVFKAIGLKNLLRFEEALREMVAVKTEGGWNHRKPITGLEEAGMKVHTRWPWPPSTTPRRHPMPDTAQARIDLPNGDSYAATVTYRDGWTRIEPERGIPVRPSGIGEDLGDDKDYIYDTDARGEQTPDAMVQMVVNHWLRDSGWEPEEGGT